MTILDRIVADNAPVIEARKRRHSLDELKKKALEQPAPLSLAAALQGKNIKLIAEVKKASPSKGVICRDFHPVNIARAYADGGASAISVLTEEKYFQGSLDYLKDIRNALGDERPPLLRKDFIVDPYQIYEARAYGADCILLITAIISPEKLAEFLELSHGVKMDCLVEVHNEAELELALSSRARIIGINNRDLNTFKVDMTTTERLKSMIPDDRIVVSESGIESREDIERLERLGVNAVLIGEALMRAPDIAGRIRELVV